MRPASGDRRDDVVYADGPGTTGRVVTGVEAECDPSRPAPPGRIGVTVDLVIGDDDDQVDVAPVVRVSAADGTDEAGCADVGVSFELPDHRAEPCLADRAEAWRCGSPRDTAHGPSLAPGIVRPSTACLPDRLRNWPASESFCDARHDK